MTFIGGPRVIQCPICGRMRTFVSYSGRCGRCGVNIRWGEVKKRFVVKSPMVWLLDDGTWLRFDTEAREWVPLAR